MVIGEIEVEADLSNGIVAALIDTLKIPGARVPSYSTIRRVMMELDYQAVTQVFNDWASQYTHNNQGQWIAIDGKSLKNTVNDCYGKQQNFVMMV